MNDKIYIAEIKKNLDPLKRGDKVQVEKLGKKQVKILEHDIILGKDVSKETLKFIAPLRS